MSRYNYNNNKQQQQQHQKAKVDPVEVYCRIRPLTNDTDNEKCLKVLDDTNLMLQIPEQSLAYRSGQTKQLIYSFTQIFDESTSQKELFDKCGYPLVQDLLNGKNGLLFTYGVTGSGKTHTMMGNQHNPGLLHRSLDCIFNSIANNQCKKFTFKPDRMNSYEFQPNGDIQLERQKREVLAQIKNNQNIGRPKVSNGDNHKLVEIKENHVYSVFISCIEIYNNYIYDLLDDVSDSTKRIEQNKESKMIKEDTRGMMYIKDVTELEIKSTEEAIEFVNHALRKRVVAYTDLNSESSRSHSIFTIRIVQTPIDDIDKKQTQIHVSQLSLVDLAGSERSKRTKNTGSRLKEAGNINSSLMALRNCMEVLRENIMSNNNNIQKKMVPYRDSKLTLLFKSYFEGTGKIKMILCINPSSLEFDETINVLKFSELVKDVLVPQAQEMRYTKSNLNDEALNDYLNTLPLNYSLKNNFPPVDIFSCDDDVTIAKLVEFLEDYNTKRNAIIMAVNTVNQHLYNKIRELSDENDKLKEDNHELRSQLDIKEKNEAKLEQKIKTLEKVINNSIVKTPSSQKENIKPMNEIESTIERKRSRDADISQFPSVNATPIATFRSSRITESTHTTIGTRYGINIPMLPPKTPSTVATTSKFTPATTTTTTSTQVQYNRYKTPAKPPVQPTSIVPSMGRDGVPVANKRQQRRSRSAETWLDHKPQTVAKIDTVLQPKMTRKKSVSKLELSDAKKSSKYVLTHQQQDDEGEVVTNLIKGDVFQSPSGGANIIFTDVETLSVRPQEIPKLGKKRISDDLVIANRNAIQERCSMAIEGHSSARKPIKKYRP